ncbi:MAG: hypothetical protein GXY50_04835 [Syntrophomonadaceae bacterium]|nr:hypothetical protein [Syntrophomonadaceae bacterium]
MEYYHRLNHIFITERLKHRLNEISNHPITTVIAPMGFGKTTAVNWWAKREVKSHTNTIILKQMIVTDSITDFWNGFCRAFRGYPKLTEQLKALGYPKDRGAISVLAGMLNDALSKSESSLYLIVDDLHILSERSLIPILLFLSRSLPECVHLVLLSRNQIFNEEERMRLGNLLCEIRVNDLRLENQEVAVYAKHCKLDVKTNELMALAELSEGWISMIYLNFKSYIQSGQWLSNSSDIFTLIDQVLLEPLPERQKEFLILIGMDDEFTLQQASFLWQSDDAKDLINTLSKNNAFITKNEHNIFRYHHMLLQCTRQKFAEKPEDYQRESYQRLGLWHFEQKEYIKAYFAYAKAQDWEGVLATLEKDKAKSLNSEHKDAFFTWLKSCPEEILIKNPYALVPAMLKSFSFHNIPEIKRMKKLLLNSLKADNQLTQEERDNLLGDAEVSESFLAYNDISAMSEYHRRACSLLSRTSLSVDPKGVWTFSAPSVLMMYHRAVGGADSENAEMKECMPYYYQVSDGHGNGSEHSFEADLFYERGQLTDADISNRIALSAAKRKNQFSIMLCCNFLSMRMAILKGDFNEMNRVSLECREWLYKEQQYALLNTLDMCLGFLYALLGHPQSAPKWMAEGRITEALVMFPATPMLHTFYNQLLLAQGEWTQVLARKEECENLYGIYNNVLCEIWLHIQLASALKYIDRREDAIKELMLALDMAVPDMILMPFAESEHYILDMLIELQASGLYEKEIEKIIALAKRFSDSRRKISLEHFIEYEDHGLSEKELKIARLAAKRKTNMEIAEELHLAEGTVRNHLSRIFNKLGIEEQGKNKRLALEKLLKN